MREKPLRAPDRAPPPRRDGNFIVADAGYFHERARRCYGLAERTRDSNTAQTLRSLGDAFEQRSRRMSEDE
jgi:hypothetical protein